MDKDIIVGTGFSGMVAHLILGDLAQVFGSDQKIKPEHRNKGFLYNKLLGLRARSYTKLVNGLANIRIHDRLIQGGNGTIWGGFFNADAVPHDQLCLLKNSNISLVPLSSEGTGSSSPNEGICQLHFSNGGTLNPALVIQNINPAYLESFKILSDGSIKLKFQKSSTSFQDVLEICTRSRLILAVGVVQLIDLLYRSSYLNEGDVLELSEFKYAIRFTFKGFKPGKDAQIIKINILRGILHHLGIQYYPRIISLIDRFIPFVFEQAFYYQKLARMFTIESGKLVAIGEGGDSKFGSSIHYCNLKINGISVNDYLGDISPSIVGLGMAFIGQSIPGPISNDILVDAIKKI